MKLPASFLQMSFCEHVLLFSNNTQEWSGWAAGMMHVKLLQTPQCPQLPPGMPTSSLLAAHTATSVPSGHLFHVGHSSRCEVASCHGFTLPFSDNY